MSDEVFFNQMVTKGLEPIESDGRFFEGYLTVQVKDKQGEVTIVDELYKVLPIWMDRGAPITDTHSNRVIGKGINFARSNYTDTDGEVYPAIKVTGKIYKDYELDNEIWRKIKSGEYKGLSFGGSTKTDRQPMRMKDGSIAYSLSKLEHYEVAVCKDPAVPLAVITDVNPIAKSNMNCDQTGCYVTKPILGAPNFEAATRKVMEESNVPKENAKRIVGAAENKKADKVIPDKSRGIMHLNDTSGMGQFNTQQEDARGVYDDKECPTCGHKKKDPETGLGVTASEYEKLGDISTRKAVVCKDCGLPKKIIKGNNVKPMTCPHCGESTVSDAGDFPKYGHINRQIRHDPASGKYSIDEDSPEWDTFSDYKDNPHGQRVPEGNDLVDVEPHVHHYAHQVHQGHTPKIKHPAHKRRLTDRKEQMEAHFSGANKGKKSKGMMYEDKLQNSGKYKKERKQQREQEKQNQKKFKKKRPTAKGMEGTFKSLLDTNKVLGKYQGNAISLARILDKDAPADIARPNQTGNVPAGKKKEPKGQSHGAQSTRERERGIKEQQDDPRYHYSKPQSMSEHRKLVPHEEIGAPEHLLYEDVTSDSQADSMRARRPYESMIKPNAILADPRKRKSLFDEIRNKIKVGRRGSKTWGGKWHFALPSTSGKEKDKPRKKRTADEEKNRKQMGTMSPEVRANYDANIAAMANPKPKKSKKKIKKFGSGDPQSMIDPNRANQGAGFAIRNQTPPKRKKTRTMQAKLGDGTYDYSS